MTRSAAAAQETAAVQNTRRQQGLDRKSNGNSVHMLTIPITNMRAQPADIRRMQHNSALSKQVCCVAHAVWPNNCGTGRGLCIPRQQSANSGLAFHATSALQLTYRMSCLSSHRVASKSSSASILWVASRATITAAASWSKPAISVARFPPSTHL